MIVTTQICLKVLDAGMFFQIQGCTLGQPAQKTLGSLVEFQTPELILWELA